jgi:hypothetical protein
MIFQMANVQKEVHNYAQEKSLGALVTPDNLARLTYDLLDANKVGSRDKDLLLSCFCSSFFSLALLRGQRHQCSAVDVGHFEYLWRAPQCQVDYAHLGKVPEKW